MRVALLAEATVHQVDASVVPVRGFGIRNFLTLFLSIEVSKAMVDKRAAAAAGDEAGAEFHGQRVALFTQQLVESNPILVKPAPDFFHTPARHRAITSAFFRVRSARVSVPQTEISDCMTVRLL